MSYAYIGVAAVVGILIGFVTLSIFWISKTVQNNIHRRTLELLTDYEDLLAERSRELALLEARIANAQPQEVAQEAAEQEMLYSEVAPAFVLKAAERISTTSYRDVGLVERYRQIQTAFQCPVEDILSRLPNAGAGGEGGAATRLLQQLDFDTVYNLTTLSGEEQHQLLVEVIPQEAQWIVQEYQEQSRIFNIIEFYTYLQGKADQEPHDTVIRVPVGMAQQVAPPHTVFVEDQGICEGIQVEMGNLLYDFCIKAREIG